MNEHEPGDVVVCIKPHPLIPWHRNIPLHDKIEVVVWDTSHDGMFIGRYWGATWWLDKRKFK